MLAIKRDNCYQKIQEIY